MACRRLGTALALIALLAGCGGGGGGGGGTPPPPTGGPGINPPPPTGTCSLSSRQSWAQAQLAEWYLFPDLLATGLNPANYSSLEAYVDALTAPARAQGRDRFFTYVTSIAEENAYYSSGSSAGFGIRLSVDVPARRLFVSEAFENAPALAANIDRGTEILAIGTSPGNLVTVSSIIASQGASGVTQALGPSDPGVTRTLQVTDAGGTRTVTITKRDYELLPVSPRYGARVIEQDGRRYGYVNLRTFISTAEQPLRDAFASFRAQGVTDIVVDFRYNGGGLVRIAELMGDLMGGNRSTADVYSFTAFRPSKSQYDETRRFQPGGQSVAPTRIAFIGTGGTASASEMVMNSFIPYLGANAALVGTNTYGKPVGQIAIDRAACDDRLRVVAFATLNADRQGAYYNGLAPFMGASCQAGDEVARPFGDPAEASLRTAIDFLAGRSCSRIAGDGARTQSLDRVGERQMELLTPERPSTAQREVPGLF